MSTGGALGGAHYGDTDIVVAKYDPSGNLMWATQLGTTGTDISYGGLWGDNQGNLYVAGKSSGSLGGPNPGGDDAVLIKLSAPGSSGAEAARSLVRSGAASTTTASILSTPDATKAGKAHSVAALASGQSISNHDSSENLAGLLAVYSRSTVDKFTRQMPSSHDLDARDRAIGELMNGELQDTLTDVLKLL
jgi:hypothetical protein